MVEEHKNYIVETSVGEKIRLTKDRARQLWRALDKVSEKFEAKELGKFVEWAGRVNYNYKKDKFYVEHPQKEEGMSVSIESALQGIDTNTVLIAHFHPDKVDEAFLSHEDMKIYSKIGGILVCENGYKIYNDYVWGLIYNADKDKLYIKSPNDEVRAEDLIPETAWRE